MYWILDLEGEVHSIWDVWISGLQECHDNGFSKVEQIGKKNWLGPENLDFSLGGCPSPNLPRPKSSSG